MRDYKKYENIATASAIAGMLAFFSIPVMLEIKQPLLAILLPVFIGIPGLVTASVLSTKVSKIKEKHGKATGVAAEREDVKEKVREERYDKFLHGLDKNNAITEPKPALSEAELMAEINLLAPKIKLFGTLSKILMVVGLIGFFPLNILLPPLGFALFIPWGIFMMKEMFCKNRLKCIISSSIIRGVLSDTFELTNYSPGCHIDSEVIREANLIPGWNRASGSDLIEGSYRGVRFSFSDLRLMQVSGSGKNQKTTMRFTGQWLIIELAKEIPHKVALREDSKARSDIETENIEFNRKFKVEAEDPHTAFYLLTPHFMEYILQTKRRANAQTHMSFSGRKANIALHSGRDLFEACSKKLYDMKNIEMLRNQMQWDVKYITGIIDELLLNEGLFNAEK